MGHPPAASGEFCIATNLYYAVSTLEGLFVELVDGLKLAQSGRALLFLGAGFSLGTPNEAGNSMKTGQLFSDEIAKKSGLPEGTGLMDSSEAYREIFGADALVKEVLAEFTASHLLPHQRAAAMVPWKQIYTTNYDDIVEKAYRLIKQSLSSFNPDAPIASVPHGVAVCIHLNGAINGLNASTLDSQIRLTDSSYLTSALSDTDWAVRFRQDIDAAQAVFFVGYSTSDIDVARILFAKPSLRDKTFFVVGQTDDAVLKRRIEKFGVDTGLTASSFFEEIAKDAYLPTGAVSIPENCLRSYVPRPARHSSDQDVFDLFMVGRFSEELAYDSISGGFRYIAHRKAVTKVLSILAMAPAVVAIHSSLGNGKTVVLEAVKIEASIAGFKVIELARQRESLFEELDFALKRGGKLLFTVDNYGDWQDALRYIGNHNNKNVSVLLAARTYTNDVLASRVEELLKLGELHEVLVDKLYDEDVTRVAQLMDVYGLWGAKSSLKLHQKEAILVTGCGREWRSILIELFKAPQIRDRLDPLVKAIQGEKNYGLILIAILVLAIVDHPASTDVLTDLCGERTLTIGFRQNRTVRELIDFESGEVRLKSAVTGAFILEQVADAGAILSSLISITKAADSAASVSREYLAIFRSLVRFGNAQNFFPPSRSNEMVLKYYEAIKELWHTKRDPLFWLQYAIASLLAHEYDRAGVYFASAYSFAKQKQFRTFQIDNHYARYLLLKSIRLDDPSLAMEHLRNARKLIYEQMQRERLHYPYRVAALIGDWFDAFGDRISDSERAEVKRSVEFIAARITELPKERQQHRDIAQCYQRMKLILASPFILTKNDI